MKIIEELHAIIKQHVSTELKTKIISGVSEKTIELVYGFVCQMAAYHIYHFGEIPKFQTLVDLAVKGHLEKVDGYVAEDEQE